MEECEGLITVDILRRAGIEVIMASVMGRIEVATSHGIIVKTDALIDDVDFDRVDLIILRRTRRHGKPARQCNGKTEMSGICKRQTCGCYLRSTECCG